VDHVRSEWHVTRAGVTWDFRGGGRTTCQGKSRGDGWDRYSQALKMLKCGSSHLAALSLSGCMFSFLLTVLSHPILTMLVIPRRRYVYGYITRQPYLPPSSDTDPCVSVKDDVAPKEEFKFSEKHPDGHVIEVTDASKICFLLTRFIDDRCSCMLLLSFGVLCVSSSK